jgi:hypothetical protein
MHPDDGTKVWPEPPKFTFGNNGVSLLYGNDSNLVTLSKEIFVYAFFDSLERETPALQYAPFDYRNTWCFAPQELWTARFDCVRADYFNDNIGALRDFYATERGEDLDGEAQDLSKPYWHGPDRTDTHTKLLLELFQEDRFRTLFYIANRTSDSDHFLQDVLRCDRWIGLGLTRSSNPPQVTLFHYDDELLEAPEVWQVTSLYALTQRRINSLRHVFSLDFVSDAWMPPPEPEPSGTPTPSGPLSMGERMAPHRRKKKEETDDYRVVKKTIFKPTHMRKLRGAQRKNQVLRAFLEQQQIEVF